MNFGEKLKKQRLNLNLTQQEVADMLNVALRTYSYYERNEKHPRKREMYKKLAEVLQLDLNYLLTEDEEFTIQAHEQYGYRGAKQAEELVNQMGALFAGGELSTNDKDAVMKALQEIYWDAKEENKKYTPKKFLKTDD